VTKPRERHPLVGMYFMMFREKEGWLDPGIFKYQGQILGVDGDVVLCQLFSALDGAPAQVRPFDKPAMYSKLCQLYADHGAFIYAADQRMRREQPYYKKMFEEGASS
jgi:hypothetical protein